MKPRHTLRIAEQRRGFYFFAHSQKSKIKVWSTSGLLIKEFFLSEGVTAVDVLGLNGIYIFEFIFEDNQREIQQVVI